MILFWLIKQIVSLIDQYDYSTQRGLNGHIWWSVRFFFHKISLFLFLSTFRRFVEFYDKTWKSDVPSSWSQKIRWIRLPCTLWHFFYLHYAPKAILLNVLCHIHFKRSTIICMAILCSRNKRNLMLKNGFEQDSMTVSKCLPTSESWVLLCWEAEITKYEYLGENICADILKHFKHNFIYINYICLIQIATKVNNE